MVIATIGGLATGVTPGLVADAGSVQCAWPGLQDNASGNAFQDGVVPSATVNVNECDGGMQGGPYTGDWYDQYQYIASTQGANESDVAVQARAWACGALAYDQTADWSYGNSLSSSWYDYRAADSHCGAQYDLNVKITAWSGEYWVQELTEQDYPYCYFQCN